jgi:hypothetical protein
MEIFSAAYLAHLGHRRADLAWVLRRSPATEDMVVN